MFKLDSPSWSRRLFLQTGALGGLGLAVGDLSAQEPPPLPARRPAETIDGPPIVSARAWTIADGRSGRRLWGANDATGLAMASTTKIMTAWIVLHLADKNANVLEEVLVVSERPARRRASGPAIASPFATCCTGCCCRRATTRR